MRQQGLWQVWCAWEEAAALRPVQDREGVAATGGLKLSADFNDFVASRKKARKLKGKYIHTTHIASHLSVATEGIMRTQSPVPATPQAVDRKMLGVLKSSGTQSLDSLSRLTGISWAQVFLSVDRLSRIGKVLLTPVRPSEYQISISRIFRR